MTAKIDLFRGKNGWLSNFYPCEIRLSGLVYPSVEHAFAASKTMDPAARVKISRAKTAAEAKRMGRFVELRSDWDAAKGFVMIGLIRQKFAHPHLRRWLLLTGDAELIEGNDWGDRFWGVCRGEGENHLGKIIMAERAAIQNRNKETDK